MYRMFFGNSRNALKHWLRAAGVYRDSRLATRDSHKVFSNKLDTRPLQPWLPSSVATWTSQPIFLKSFSQRISFFVLAPNKTALFIFRSAKASARKTKGATPMPPAIKRVRGEG